MGVETSAARELPRRRLGGTAVSVTEIGLGAAPLGNLYAEISDADAEATVTACWTAGIRYFDTAPYYGFGLSEERLGAALAARPRAQFTVSTKVGRALHPVETRELPAERHGFRSARPYEPRFDYSYDGVMRSFESSLRRLRVDRVDILLVHDLGSLTHGAQHLEQLHTLRTSGLRALETLRRSGAVGALGLGCNEWEICDEALEWDVFDAFLVAGRYTLIEQGMLHRFLPRCADRGASVVLGGIFNSGILASGTRSGGTIYYDYAPASERILEKVRALEQVCARFNVPLAAAALQFALAGPSVAAVVPGARSPQEVGRALHYRSAPIPQEFWSELIARGLIDAAAPVPPSTIRGNP